jgi:hypothetical protein
MSMHGILRTAMARARGLHVSGAHGPIPADR